MRALIVMVNKIPMMSIRPPPPIASFLNEKFDLAQDFISTGFVVGADDV